MEKKKAKSFIIPASYFRAKGIAAIKVTPPPTSETLSKPVSNKIKNYFCRTSSKIRNAIIRRRKRGN
jgi:hypothetical protein